MDVDFRISYIDNNLVSNIETVYVIPGGGSSSGTGYPEWTQKRVVAVYNHYLSSSKSGSHSVFLALSAGSLNSANRLFDDQRIIFECQHVIKHLIKLGIPKDLIFGDMFSWDTVTNGYSLRLFLEGILLYRMRNYLKKNTPKKSIPLMVEVFISDFHAARVKAAFEWILGLKPSLKNVQLNINIIDSFGIERSSPGEFNQRMQHEEEGVKKIKENGKMIRTVKQFHAFLMLGGHQGLSKYLHGDYVKSTGTGW
ncbi:MAG: hypothetical protein H6586_09125 [Flavobacteriales bacterium]|nr:hypothetical protein [Leptospiraceae bacterium]MCB9336299.1 hypothetical protein [Flavobacteriales bacterium]